MRVPARPGRYLRVHCPATASPSPRACPQSGCRALVSRSPVPACPVVTANPAQPANVKVAECGREALAQAPARMKLSWPRQGAPSHRLSERSRREPAARHGGSPTRGRSGPCSPRTVERCNPRAALSIRDCRAAPSPHPGRRAPSVTPAPRTVCNHGERAAITGPHRLPLRGAIVPARRGARWGKGSCLPRCHAIWRGGVSLPSAAVRVRHASTCPAHRTPGGSTGPGSFTKSRRVSGMDV
jgi:hypothetical protein